MPSLLRSRRDPADEENVVPVSETDHRAIEWLRSQGLDPRDFTFGERVQMYRQRDVPPFDPSSPEERYANSPDEWTGESDNVIPYRPSGQATPGWRGSEHEHRSPEWYDDQYGHWGSLIRQLEGGDDWGPYRRLEAQQRLDALGPDLVQDYGPGWDPTAGIEAGDYTGERNTRAPAAVHDPAIDGPFAGLERALREGQADAGAYAGLDQPGRELLDSIFPPGTDPARPSDAMPLPFLEPRTDEERTEDQLMEADRARQQGAGRPPPSAAQRWGITPPGLRMADSAASMPGPNTAMVGGNPDWNGEWDAAWGDQPPGTQTPGQGGAFVGKGGFGGSGDWNPDWGAYGGLTSEDRLDYFRNQYQGLIDQLQETFAPEQELLGMKPEDMPRQGPGSAASQGRQLVRPGDMGLPPRTPDEVAGASIDPDQYVAQLDDYGRRREEWVLAHPELWPPEGMTDETDNVPAEFNSPGGLGFGGDETDRWWYGPRNNVGPEDFERMPTRKPRPDLNTVRAYQNDPDSPRPDMPIDPNTMMANPGLNMPGLPGPNTAMGRILPTGDEDMRPWWMRALDSFNGSGGWGLPGMQGIDVMPPGDPGSMTVLPPEQPPPYNWGDDPDVAGPNTYAMGDGQVRSLNAYRQQKERGPHPAGTGWADLLERQMGSGPGEGELAGAPGFQSLADIARQMGLDPDAAVTSLDEWRNRGNAGEQLPLFDPNSTMSGNGAVPRGLGGFRSQYRPQQLGGFQPARPMAPLGGFGRPHSLPPMGGYGSRGAGIPSSTNFSMQRHFNKPHHEPFDGMAEAVARNSGKILVGTAAGIGGAALLAAGAAGRLLSPFGG